MVAFRLVLALAALTSVWAHPIHQQESRDLRIVGRTTSGVVRRQESAGDEFATLFEGNQAFKAKDG